MLTVKLSTDRKKFRLYALDHYAQTKDFINNGFKEYCLTDLLEELENNKGYHMRIDPTKSYIFFGDCDHFNGSFDVFRDLLIKFLKTHYDLAISIDDISYTENESVKGSFHYSIPKFYASCKKLQEIHTNFFEKHKDIFIRKLAVVKNGKTDIEKKKVVDTSIYVAKWFRYPLQHKAGMKNTCHIIKCGEMNDFVVEHIPKKSQCIDDREYIHIPGNNNVFFGGKKFVVKRCDPDKTYNDEIKHKEPTKNLFRSRTAKKTAQNNNNSVIRVKDDETKLVVFEDSVENLDDNDNINTANEKIDIFRKHITSPFRIALIKKILASYSINICNNYDTWLNIGMALKNESYDGVIFFESWDDWSSKGSEYDGTKINKEKWDSFILTKGGYSMSYMLSILMTDNNKAYKTMNEYINFHKIIVDSEIGSIVNRDDDENNNVYKIEKMNRTLNSLCATLTGDLCYICEDEHSDKGSERFIELNHCGIMGIKCTDKKCRGKMCPEGGLFISEKHFSQMFVQNTFNIRIGGGTKIYNIKEILNDDTQIFEDDKLNKLVIKSLYNDDESIIDAIIFVNKDKFCCEDSVWYFFNNNLWKKSDKAVKYIIKNFITLFTQVKMFVKNKSLNAMIKYGYIDQIDKFIEDIKKPKKRKELIEMVQEQMTRKNRFDTNFNLLGFSNGVYDFDQMLFRQEMHTDMVKKSCGYDYCDEYNDKEALLEKLANIFPTEESKEFFLMCIAAALCGKAPNILIIITCENEYLRELLIDMLSLSLGEYSCIFNELSEIVVKDEKIPNDLLELKTTRVVVTENTKNITNNVISRTIRNKRIGYKHENITEKFNVKFLTICVCEKPPIIDKKNEKYIVSIPISNDDEENFEYAQNDFLLLLLEYLEKCREQNFLIDKSIIEEGEYTDDEKVCNKFIKECLEKKDDCRVKSKDVYDKYKEWNKTKNGKKITNQKFFSLIQKLDKDLKYNTSIKINGKTTTGFDGVKIKD